MLTEGTPEYEAFMKKRAEGATHHAAHQVDENRSHSTHFAIHDSDEDGTDDASELNKLLR